MKSIVIPFVLILFISRSYSQERHNISFFKDSKAKIISCAIDKEPNRLPTINFTIQNKTKENLIFTTIALEVVEFRKHPRSSSSNNELDSKILSSIGGFDLPISSEVGTNLFVCKSPIQIGKKDAATVTIRISYPFGNKIIVPGQIGYFKLKILFLTYDNKAVSSEDIELGYK